MLKRKDYEMRIAKLTGALFLAMALLAGTPAQAYVGPGLGAGAIAVIVGILGAIGMAFVGTVWYPIKRLVKKRAAKKKPDDSP